MLKYILLDTKTFDGETRAAAEEGLMWVLEALSQRNQIYLTQHPDTPKLYKSGVVWEKPRQFDGDCEEVRVLKQALGRAAKKSDVKEVLRKVQQILGGEHFCDIGVILDLGKIDCDGLACWRVAELRQAGIPARPMMTSRMRPDGGVTYHAIVRWPPFGDAISGNPYEDTDEDPSLLLGMAQPQKKAERDEEIRKNIERCDYIRRRKAGMIAQPNLNALVEGVLGLSRGAPSSIEAQIEQMMYRGNG